MAKKKAAAEFGVPVAQPSPEMVAPTAGSAYPAIGFPGGIPGMQQPGVLQGNPMMAMMQR